MNKRFLFNCWGDSDSLSSAAGPPWSLHGNRIKHTEGKTYGQKEKDGDRVVKYALNINID